jgi:hypothetical protein
MPPLQKASTPKLWLYLYTSNRLGRQKWPKNRVRRPSGPVRRAAYQYVSHPDFCPPLPYEYVSHPNFYPHAPYEYVGHPNFCPPLPYEYVMPRAPAEARHPSTPATRESSGEWKNVWTGACGFCRFNRAAPSRAPPPSSRARQPLSTGYSPAMAATHPPLLDRKLRSNTC